VKILFVSSSGAGHVQPLLGLAIAARQAGHDTAWATATDAHPLLVSHGIATLGAGIPFHESIAEYRRRWPEVAGIPPRGHAFHAFPRLFGNVVMHSMLQPLLRHVEQWRPSLVVHEPAALAAPLAASAFGIRHLVHAFGLPIPDPILAETAAAVAPAWTEAGLDAPTDAGLYAHGAIEIAPPSLLAATPHPVRGPRVLRHQPDPVTAEPGARLPPSLHDFLARHDAGPVVYCTFGTLNRGGPSFDGLWRSLPEMQARFVVTTGAAQAAHAAVPLPPNVWAAPYVPHDLVLPHCAAVISHAGSGTALAACRAGLPQLCLPQGADQFRNADALAVVGAAIVLEGGRGGVSGYDMREAAGEILAGASVKRAAAMLQEEIAAMPASSDVVEALR
jgi:UDP:flavonoid glycosyltransferase YjiC (YdhE family)